MTSSVELLADSNLDKTIVGSQILLQIWADRRICILLFTPPPPPPTHLRQRIACLIYTLHEYNSSCKQVACDSFKPVTDEQVFYDKFLCDKFYLPSARVYMQQILYDKFSYDKFYLLV